MLQNDLAQNVITYKILIVDDDPNNKEILSLYLRCFNVEIHTASNGLEALDKFEQIKDLSLVIMDIHMPFMTGLEACREMKKSKPDIPVIIDTAYSSDDDHRIIADSGADDYLLKPYGKDAFIEALGRFIPVLKLDKTS